MSNIEELIKNEINKIDNTFCSKENMFFDIYANLRIVQRMTVFEEGYTPTIEQLIHKYRDYRPQKDHRGVDNLISKRETKSNEALENEIRSIKEHVELRMNFLVDEIEGFNINMNYLSPIIFAILDSYVFKDKDILKLVKKDCYVDHNKFDNSIKYIKKYTSELIKSDSRYDSTDKDILNYIIELLWWRDKLEYMRSKLFELPSTKSGSKMLKLINSENLAAFFLDTYLFHYPTFFECAKKYLAAVVYTDDIQDEILNIGYIENEILRKIINETAGEITENSLTHDEINKELDEINKKMIYARQVHLNGGYKFIKKEAERIEILGTVIEIFDIIYKFENPGTENLNIMDDVKEILKISDIKKAERIKILNAFSKLQSSYGKILNQCRNAGINDEKTKIITNASILENLNKTFELFEIDQTVDYILSFEEYIKNKINEANGSEKKRKIINRIKKIGKDIFLSQNMLFALALKEIFDQPDYFCKNSLREIIRDIDTIEIFTMLCHCQQSEEEFFQTTENLLNLKDQNNDIKIILDNLSDLFEIVDDINSFRNDISKLKDRHSEYILKKAVENLTGSETKFISSEFKNNKSNKFEIYDMVMNSFYRMYNDEAEAEEEQIIVSFADKLLMQVSYWEDIRKGNIQVETQEESISSMIDIIKNHTQEELNAIKATLVFCKDFFIKNIAILMDDMDELFYDPLKEFVDEWTDL